MQHSVVYQLLTYLGLLVGFSFTKKQTSTTLSCLLITAIGTFDLELIIMIVLALRGLQ